MQKLDDSKKDTVEYFLTENTIKTNKLFARILLSSNIVGPFLFMGYKINLFNVTASYCLSVMIMTLFFSFLHFFMVKKLHCYKYLMYQGIVFLATFIGYLALNGAVGVYISYALVSFICCVYMDEYVTTFTSIYSYLVMIISLYFRGNALFLREQGRIPNIMEYFIPNVLGFSLEFFFVFLFTTAITKQFYKTIFQIKSKSSQIDVIQDKLIQAFADTVEMNDPTTGMHVKRTSEYVRLISTRLKELGYYKEILTTENIKLFTKAAPLHDIGKFSISNNILTKPGKYTEEEYEEMKTHAERGHELIEKEFYGLENEDFVIVASFMAWSHHEKWDGTGYPLGFKGLEIPLCARIMAAADVLDALLNVRQYKRAFSIEETFDIFRQEQGKQFEPCIVEAVLSLKSEIMEINNRFNDSEKKRKR